MQNMQNQQNQIINPFGAPRFVGVGDLATSGSVPLQAGPSTLIPLQAGPSTLVATTGAVATLNLLPIQSAGPITINNRLNANNQASYANGTITMVIPEIYTASPVISGQDRPAISVIAYGQLDPITNTISFAQGVQKTDLIFTGTVNDLIIKVKNSTMQTVVKNYFSTDLNTKLKIQFADGGQINPIDFLAMNISRTGTSANDTFATWNGSQTIHGDAGNDTINAGAGNDILKGGLGNDTLNGGLGSDTYIFNKGDGQDVIMDTFELSNAFDTIQFGNGIKREDLIFTGNVNDLIIKLKNSNDQVTIKNYFTSSIPLSLQIKLADQTTLKFEDIKAINITRTATNNQDHILMFGAAWLGAETIYAGAGNDVIDGSLGRDTLWGEAGDDTLLGGGNDDTLYGGVGNDILKGGEGNDVLNGGLGDDLLEGGYDDDNLEGSAGKDTLYGGEGQDILYGGDQNDTLYGDQGDDRLYGGVADDILIGDEGNDFLNGDTGNDNINGGSGSDTYAFNKGGGRDTITDTSLANSTDKDILKFNNADQSQLWFRKINAVDLEVSIIGTNDAVIVKDWYKGTVNQIEEIKSPTKTLAAANVDKLVQAMAAFGVPASGQTTLTETQRKALDPILSANWK